MATPVKFKLSKNKTQCRLFYVKKQKLNDDCEDAPRYFQQCERQDYRAWRVGLRPSSSVGRGAGRGRRRLAPVQPGGRLCLVAPGLAGLRRRPRPRERLAHWPRRLPWPRLGRDGLFPAQAPERLARPSRRRHAQQGYRRLSRPRRLRPRVGGDGRGGIHPSPATLRRFSGCETRLFAHFSGQQFSKPVPNRAFRVSTAAKASRQQRDHRVMPFKANSQLDP